MIFGHGLIHRHGVFAIGIHGERPFAFRVCGGGCLFLTGKLQLHIGDWLLIRILQDAINASVRGGRVARRHGLSRECAAWRGDTQRHQ